MISVVIVVHNVLEALGNITDMTNVCVNSLYATASMPFELILVDNGSRDYPQTFDALKVLASAACELRLSSVVTRNESNSAISKCWNDAIALSTGEYIFLINNDVTFYSSGWMNVIVAALNRSNAGVVGLQGMGWNGFSFIEGSCFCFNRSLADQLSGGTGRMFDEQFIFSCEDADVCQRVQDAGFTIYQEPILVNYMVHAHHGTLSYVDRENGMVPGRPIQYTTHDMRKLLCRKWGKPETIFD